MFDCFLIVYFFHLVSVARIWFACVFHATFCAVGAARLGHMECAAARLSHSQVCYWPFISSTHSVRYMNRPVMSCPGLYDPTTIMNADQLSRSMREGWIKLGFYLISFFYYLYAYVCTYMFLLPSQRASSNWVWICKHPRCTSPSDGYMFSFVNISSLFLPYT